VAITTIAGASGSDLTTLKGTELTDTFTLVANSLYLDGLGASDTVTAANAVDKITAVTGTGGDSLTFSGALTNANLDLGDGNDVTAFQDFAGTVIGGTGNDIVDSNRATSSSAVKLGTGNDSVIFDTTLSSSSVWGNADDDTITVVGATTSSTVYGGRQRDVISVAAATGSKIRGDKNNDTITVTGSITNVIIQGNADDDQINISSAKGTSSTVFGGKGVDDINITAAATGLLVRGDDGKDVIDVTGNGAMTISGGADADSITSSSTVASNYFGGKGNDTMTVNGVIAKTSTKNSVFGNVGNDVIVGSASADLLDGGEGKDTITGAGGKDTIDGQAGADSISTTGASTVNIQGGADNDTILVSVIANLTKDDSINGETGTDVLQVNTGDTLVDNDLKNVSNVSTLDLGLLTAAAVVGANAQAAGITTITAASSASDTGVINASAYTSTVGTTLVSSKTNATSISGGAGTDTFTSQGTGNHSLKGGSGIDTFNHTSTGTGALQDLGTGGNDIFTVANTAGVLTAVATANYTAASTVNNAAAVTQAVITASGFDINMSAVLSGTSGFTINGNATAATLTGSGLADAITGGTSAESIVGGAGNDTILGGTGSDTIQTGAGTNDVTGGAAADVVTLGANAEQAIFTATAAASTATETGAAAGTDNDFAAGTVGDQIISFTSGSDKINFTNALLINAIGTEIDTLATIAAGGVVANTNSFVEITTALTNAEMGTAIIQLNGLTTTAVAVSDTFIAFQNDGTDGYLYLVQQASTANTIAAQDVTLIGQIKGVINIADGDLTSLA
jgi:Ca2+-binding RTX toxin-like protein